MRCLVIVIMSKAKTVKFQVYLPEDLRTRFKAKCVISGATMNETAVKLIEAWTDKDEPSADDAKLAQSQSKPATFKEFVEVRGGALLKRGGIDPKRIQAFTHGTKPSSRERQIIAKMLDIPLEEVPE